MTDEAKQAVRDIRNAQERAQRAERPEEEEQAEHNTRNAQERARYAERTEKENVVAPPVKRNSAKPFLDDAIVLSDVTEPVHLDHSQSTTYQ